MATALSDTLQKDIRVEPTAIEKKLAEMWRSSDDGDTLTRAALWNVVAHTCNAAHQTQASEVLGRASAAVPQRTIIVRSNPAAEAEISSWISANCHPVGGGKQVCSEEIAIVAGGDRVQRVPPLVHSLLIPDMPVAVWWIGDLPNEHEDYVESLLDPADRLIVDSVHFDSPADLALVSRVAARTTTAPADLNWVRLEEWRSATASIFDPPDIRQRLHAIRRVRVVSASSETNYFGESIESLLFASWISAQVDHHVDEAGKVEGASGSIEYVFERHRQQQNIGSIIAAEIGFDDGSSATITRDRERGVLMANVDGNIAVPESVTRAMSLQLDALIIRQLKRTEGDRVLVRVLPIAARLAKRIAG